MLDERKAGPGSLVLPVTLSPNLLEAADMQADDTDNLLMHSVQLRVGRSAVIVHTMHRCDDDSHLYTVGQKLCHVYICS